MSVRGWWLFAAVGLLWGVTYSLIKVAVDAGLAPVFVTWVRLFVAAIVLVALAWRAGVLEQVRGRLRWLVVFAVVELAVPQPLIAAGEKRVPSSLTAILIAAAPLFVTLLALRFDAGERPSRRGLLGLVVGFVGVAALVGVEIAAQPGELIGAIAILVAAVCYAVGPLVVKRYLRDLDPRASMGVSIAIAAFLLTPTLAIDQPTEVPAPGAMAALAGLALFCTAAAFVFYSALISEVGARRALVVTYINPVVALLVGVSFLGERPGSGAALGLILILTGCWLATGGHVQSKPPHRRLARVLPLLRRLSGDPVQRLASVPAAVLVAEIHPDRRWASCDGSPEPNS